MHFIYVNELKFELQIIQMMLLMFIKYIYILKKNLPLEGAIPQM